MISDRRQSFFRLLPESALPLLMFILMFFWQIAKDTPFQDPDTGWHIRAGEWILAHRLIPAHDIWSYTAGNAPWYNLSWLFDTVLSALYQLGGLPLLYLLTITAYASIAAILANQAQRRGAGFVAIVTTFAICFLPMISQVALCRPNIVSAFMLLAFMHILQRDRENPSAKRLVWLPVFMVVWVNMHGGFLIAPFLFAAHLIEAWVMRDSARAKRIIIIGSMTALAILINPYGAHIVEGTLRTLNSAMTNNISEWQPVNLKKNLHYAVLLVLFIIAFRPKDRTVPLAEKLFMLTALMLGLFYARHGLVLAIATAPILAANLSRMAYESPVGEMFFIKDEDFLRDMKKPPVLNAALLLCILSMAAMIVFPSREMLAPHADALNQGKTPQKAIAYIEKNYPHMRWMNEYSTGGLLIYYGIPQTALFIDGRAGTAYNENVIKDDLDFSEGWGMGKKADAVIEKWNIDGLIMPSSSKITRYLNTNPTWKNVYQDNFISLFIHASSAGNP